MNKMSVDMRPGKNAIDQFESITASELYCNRCKRATPVREKLLLVLPGKYLFDYLCSQCGQSLGKREKPDPRAFSVNAITLPRRA